MNENLELVAKVLLIVGGLNWGLVIFGINLVEIISFGVNMVANVIYALVAIAAIIELVALFKK